MDNPAGSYFGVSGWDPRDVVSGGSRMIPVTTPIGEFRVWTKRVGTNPDVKVLLLNGAAGRLARPGQPVARAHQSGDLRADARDPASSG
jgi:hypothetical protein